MIDSNGLIHLSETSKQGNTISLFYNQESGLVVVEFIRQDEQGGFEILRQKFDESDLLKDENFNFRIEPMLAEN